MNGPNQNNQQHTRIQKYVFMWNHTHSREASGLGQDSGLSTIEFKAFDLDHTVMGDNRKSEDMKVGNIFL